MNDQIEPIPKTMEKFFGTSGKMVKPSSKTLESLIAKIPKGQISTIEDLRSRLAASFGVERACPASTTKALKAISREETNTPYWRVVKKKGELISQLSIGCEGHAQKLEDEGFTIDHSKKSPVVKFNESSLYKFT
ncbi:MGMT family protein [Puniceicoccaceae bacterium K14]|nr:MGMT family protein [Puniceicoccaceae bacterium K14]